MNKNIVIGLLVFLLLIGGYYLFTKPATAPAPTAAPVTASPAPEDAMMTKEISFDLEEQNNSTESGTATLKEVDGQMVVTLILTGAPKGVTKPAHIHSNTCADIGGVVYPLTFPVDGHSETTLDTTFDKMTAQMPLALNVHKSAAESNIYVACGDLPQLITP